MRYLFRIFLLAVLLPHHHAVAADNHYLISLDPDWEVKPILTVGENAINGYVMAGIPDGLGAFDNGNGSFTILMNHEIGGDKGKLRSHGHKGAFVSRWVVDTASLKVMTGEDLVKRTVPHDLAFNRLCSADLAPRSAFFDIASGKGYDGRLFLNGEEDKSGGRAFAHALDGTSYALPDLGRFSWENLLAHPDSHENTLVMGMDDVQDGLVLVYIGTKRKNGNPAEQAGLMGGRLYALKVEGMRFSLVALAKVTDMDGKSLRTLAQQSGATRFARPEDGAWDTQDSKKFWFATTDKIDGDSRLYRLVFDDINKPEQGGSFATALHARDIGAQMFDNITVDSSGRVLLNEDPGEDRYPSGIWLYDPSTPSSTKRLVEAKADHFVDATSPHFMTHNEEQSGIIEITALFKNAPWFQATKRYYLGVMQIHKEHQNPDLVTHGQLYLLSGSAK